MDLPSAMPFPFGKSQKSPAEIVKTLRENVAHLEKLDAGDSKKFEKVSLCGLSLSDKNRPSEYHKWSAGWYI